MCHQRLAIIGPMFQKRILRSLQFDIIEFLYGLPGRECWQNSRFEALIKKETVPRASNRRFVIEKRAIKKKVTSERPPYMDCYVSDINLGDSKSRVSHSLARN